MAATILHSFKPHFLRDVHFWEWLDREDRESCSWAGVGVCFNASRTASRGILHSPLIFAAPGRRPERARRATSSRETPWRS